MKILERVHGQEHPDVAVSISHLAELYRTQGQYRNAESMFQRSLAIRRRIYGEVHHEVATSLNELAALYQALGRREEAVPLYQQSLRIRERTLGPDHPDVAISLNNLAILALEQGRYADAEVLFERGLLISEKALGPNHLDVALVLNNLGELYRIQERHEAAEPLFQRSLEIREAVLGTEHPGVTVSLNNLAIVHAAQGLYEKAIPLLQRSMQIDENYFGPDHPRLAYSLNNLANLYRIHGRLATAEPLYERSLRIRESVFGAEHPEVAASLNSLALLYQTQGRQADAETMIERAIAIQDGAGAAAGNRFASYNLRADLRWQTGRQTEALADLNLALVLAESQRAQLGGIDQQRAQAFERFSTAYERMIAWQHELDNVDAVLDAAERSRARGLIEQIAATGLDLMAGLPEAEATRLRQREQRALARVAEIEKQSELLLARHGPDDADARQQQEILRAELIDARQEVVDAYAAIRNASPAYRQAVGQNFTVLSLTEIQRELAGSRGLAMEYALGDHAGYVIVIPPMGQPARVERLALDAEQAKVLGVVAGPLTADVLHQILVSRDGQGVLDQLRRPQQSETVKDKLSVLWQVLVPPTEREALMARDFDDFVILPDGPLLLLPFEALVVDVGPQTKYLLDVGPPIQYAPSGTILVNLKLQPAKSQTADREPVLTIGDPIYARGDDWTEASSTVLEQPGTSVQYGVAGGVLTPLPFSGIESRWISQVCAARGIEAGQLLESQATEANVRSHAPGRKIVHLACHGLVDVQHGNFFGALALTPGSQHNLPNDDGFLTLPEIHELDLKGCELAILSACETNIGPQQRGEGVWALSRGFLVAGARRVVASNWLVDDKGTASLMSYFASILVKAEQEGRQADHATALRDAKRWLREQDQYQSPYFWATFVLLGPK